MWRYSVGQKGVNRVTAYERPDATCIYVEWWDNEGGTPTRHRKGLRTITGEPVTDREIAKKAVAIMAQAQERRRNQRAAELLGIVTTRTLLDLLKRLHMDKAAEWSDAYRRDQDRYRTLWESKLGEIALTGVTPATVERIAREAYADKPTARARSLRYLVDAFYYAERKLKWIEPRHNLSAVNIPKPKGESKPYTSEEAQRLLPALERVDWRAGWIGYVAFQTGRRLTAIRTLPKHPEWFRDHGDYGVLRFPGETDKARNTGEAVVTDDTLRLSRRAHKRYSVPTMEECQDWLRRAEEVAGIPHRRGRSWHGLKRLYATLAKGHPGREKQAGTTGPTLDRVYVQDELGPKLELAKILAGRLS